LASPVWSSTTTPGLRTVSRVFQAWIQAGLRLEGQSAHGRASFVLPVVRQDGAAAMLKLQRPNDENVGEALGLRTWDGDGAVRVLEDDPATCTLLLERLDDRHPLSAVGDHMEAVQILSELLVRRCADTVAGLLNEPGDRLLHWDLHYDNILASPDREPWLAIDPEPLAGDPAFDLLPELDNRWDDVVATGDVTRAVRRRFDLMTEVLGLDRQRAVGWTLGRVLQNALWNIEDGTTALRPDQVAIADALMDPTSR
jgi:streptomycin 6-kinase